MIITEKALKLVQEARETLPQVGEGDWTPQDSLAVRAANVVESLIAERSALWEQLSGARKLGLLAIFAAESIGEDDVLAFAEAEKKRIEAMGAKRALEEAASDMYKTDGPQAKFLVGNWLRARAEQIENNG